MLNDPSFEESIVSTSQQLADGITIGNNGAWTVGNYVTLYNGAANGHGWTAANGNQAVLLRSTDSVIKGSVSQDFAVVGGQLYNLSFDMGAVQADGVKQATLQVQIGFPDEGNFLVIKETSLSTGMRWEQQSMQFTVPAGHDLAELTFSDVGRSGSIAAAIDGVRLTAVPEPGQFGLVGVFALLGYAGRRIYTRKSAA